jgi:hypothetical protein
VQEIVEPKHAALHDERNLNDDESFAKASLGVPVRNDIQLENVSGIDWNCVSDEFLIQITTLTERAKSYILSILAGLYDPFGFVIVHLLLPPRYCYWMRIGKEGGWVGLKN